MVKDPAAPHHSRARGGALQQGQPAASEWAVVRPGGRDVGIMAVAVAGVSLSAPLTALVVAPALAIAFWRNAAGAALLLPVLLTRERSTLAGLRPRQLTSSVVAGLFLAAHFAAWLPSLSMTSVAASTALVTTTPVWTALAARLTGRERMLVLCSPHNPGGRIWSRDELRAVAGFCAAHDLVLVADEIHHVVAEAQRAGV